MEKGSHQTEDARRKISEATMGRTPWNKGKKGVQICSDETRKKRSETLMGHICSMKGKHIPGERKKRISKSTMGEKNHFFGKKHSAEALAKMSESHKNMSEETKQKISETLKNGKSYWKGKHMPDEIRKKISEAKKGERNPMWKGGITLGNKRKLSYPEWNKIRHEVYRRDNYTCRGCGIIKVKIHAHHIVPYRISLDDSMENLITLCVSCHTKEEYRYYKNLKERGMLF